jgi:hypothetical protein
LRGVLCAGKCVCVGEMTPRVGGLESRAQRRPVVVKERAEREVSSDAGAAARGGGVCEHERERGCECECVYEVSRRGECPRKGCCMVTFEAGR